MARAVSTVLDVAVCLLLVGLAVGALTTTIPNEESQSTTDADPLAASLTTVTTTVPTSTGRAVHGTLAEQLADGSIAGVTIDGESMTASTYPDAVQSEVASHVPVRSHVTAQWKPFRGSTVQSRISVGSKPPQTADVAATTRSLDAGMTVPETTQIDSFETLAASIATAFIERLFPPERVRVQLLDSRTAQSTARRYRSAAESVGIDIDSAVDTASTNRANDRLATALARTVERDLRASFDTAAAAQAELQIGYVELVVRRWES